MVLSFRVLNRYWMKELLLYNIYFQVCNVWDISFLYGELFFLCNPGMFYISDFPVVQFWTEYLFDLFKSVALFQLSPLFSSNFISSSFSCCYWKQPCILCVVELHGTVSYRRILGVAQQCFCDKCMSPVKIIGWLEYCL